MSNDLFKYYALTKYYHNIQNGNIKLKDYKTYDLDMGDKIKFVIYDISSYIEENMISTFELNYFGNLEFSYDKINKLLYISVLPSLEYEHDKFQVFTNDLLEIMRRVLSKYVSIEEVEIVFNRFAIFAYSSDVEKLIQRSENYKLINNIIRRTDAIIESLNKKILNNKKRLEECDRKRENVLQKRMQIFGIKKDDFENILDYRSALNEKVVEYAQKELNRYGRHLKINKEKYKDTLRKIFDENQEYINELIYPIRDELNLESIEEDDYDFDKEWTDILSLDDKEKILNYLVEEETKTICDLKRELDPDWKAQNKPGRDSGEEYIRISTYDYGMEFVRELCNFYISNGNYENHPIYTSGDKKLIFKMLNLAFQINSLQKKVNYFQNIISNPNDAYMEFKRDNILWGTILEMPCFFKFAYDAHYAGNREIINLLMVKPGISKVDLDSLICFGKYEKEGFDRYKYHWYDNDRYEHHKEIIKEFTKEKRYNADRLIVTLSNSLELEEVYKLIHFAIQYGHSINFICESLVTALEVKRYIVLNELCMQQQDRSFIGKNGNIFINVDPIYYQTYFTNLPTNKAFFHMYDYSSDYRYSRKDINSLSAMIGACIVDNKYKNGNEVNYEEVEEQLLGSVEELKYGVFSMSPCAGIYWQDRLYYNNFSSIKEQVEDFIEADSYENLYYDYGNEMHETLKRIEKIKEKNKFKK